MLNQAAAFRFSARPKLPEAQGIAAGGQGEPLALRPEVLPHLCTQIHHAQAEAAAGGLGGRVGGFHRVERSRIGHVFNVFS